MNAFRKIFLVCCAGLVSGMIACVPPQRYDEGYGSTSAIPSGERATRIGIVRTAQRQIGVPYRMGGLSPRGFDCSGLTLYSYRKNGIRIPRTASQQFKSGKKITLRTARPGDLVFFSTNGGRYSHVGVYRGKGEFIHSPSSGSTVRIDSISNPYWKAHYTGAAKYIR